MMFPKPQKRQKEKSPYNSLRGPKKPKKPQPAWKEGLLSHHKSTPSRKDRAEFPREVVAELIVEADEKCQDCFENKDTTTHHVMPRGRGGRGVKSNGLRLCGVCHDKIQTSEELLQYWISIYRERHGEHFWFDEQDWEEHGRKQRELEEREKAAKHRQEAATPVIDMLSTATGRRLRAPELRLIESLSEKELSIMARLMEDVTAPQQASVADRLGYGYFDD